MKNGTYIASTKIENGAVMFRVDNKPYTLRKGKDIEVDILERNSVIFPKEFMTLVLKSESQQKEKEIKTETKTPQKEVKEESVKVEEKPQPQKKTTVKTETKTPQKEVKTPVKRGRKKTVKIETEETK